MICIHLCGSSDVVFFVSLPRLEVKKKKISRNSAKSGLYNDKVQFKGCTPLYIQFGAVGSTQIWLGFKIMLIITDRYLYFIFQLFFFLWLSLFWKYLSKSAQNRPKLWFQKNRKLTFVSVKWSVKQFKDLWIKPYISENLSREIVNAINHQNINNTKI